MHKNGRTDVCLSAGIWRASGNPNPYYDLVEISHLSKEGFDAGLAPAPSPWACGAQNTKS